MVDNIATVLISRPEPQGTKLAQTLQSQGFTTLCQPMFTYQSVTNRQTIEQQLAQQQPQILIFISVSAVEYAHQALSLPSWLALAPIQTVIAVGPTTQQKLTELGIESICPKQHDSEGMLALTDLATDNIKGQRITIVRGEDGREHLAKQLNAAGATVNYLPVYQKQWLSFPADVAKRWQQQSVNCIVVTSSALLKSLVHLIDITDNHWCCDCLWLVASERIALQAKNFGLQNVINCHGATNQAILTTLLNMDLTDDR